MNCHGLIWYQSKVVPGMMWLTCEGKYWKYFTYERRSHSNKIVDCGLAYILGELNTVWFWETINLTKCICKSTLLTREFVGPSSQVFRLHMSGPR